MALGPASPPLTIGRYAFHGEIASGGMATVHFARLIGPGGFSRIVAAKRLLPHLVKDQEFTTMLMDEARLAARIRHPNVVSTLDVVSTGDELLVVMDYVHGESLAKLARTASDLGEPVPPAIAAALMIDALHGLHAAHEVTDESGQLLGLVHRDISPHNVLVGVDGVARIADFGIAKAAGRAHETRDGTVKGKLSYMAPEQVQRGELSRATDIFAISVILWELLAGTRLFDGDNDGAVVHQVLTASAPDLGPEMAAYDAIVRRGLSKNPTERYQTAREMALALEAAAPPIRPSEVGAWVERVASDTLTRRARAIAKIERAESVEIAAPANGAQTRSLARPAPLTPAAGASEDGPGTGARVSWSRADASPSKPPATPASSGEGARLGEPERSARWPALIAAVAVVGGAGAWALLRTPPVVAPLVTEASSPPPAPVPPREPVSATQAVPPPPSAAAPAAAPSVTAKARAPQHGKPAAKATKSARNCDPPYSVDASGRRLFKLECM